jgi:hypothetical protein
MFMAPVIIFARIQIATRVYRLTTDWVIGSSSPGRGWEFFCSPTASRLALGPTQSPI